ncbi:VOC family protein [Nocardia sp. NPDC052001]|uniref:VOC family protein n=1 Tax=Nocardia sp. NPDC052001 TaxID=3154853 RepID=UPI00342BED14
MRLLLQATNDGKMSKERMHLDIETDNVDAEVARLERLGAPKSPSLDPDAHPAR